MIKSKITAKSGSAPQRPPAVDEDTQYALVILLSYNLIHMG
jgi:hypothetical protein